MNTNFRILIVEDEIDAAEGLAEIFGHYGFDCTITDPINFHKVFLANYHNFFDAVITDLYMPKFNGADVHEYIKLEFPDVPVILFSGSPDTTLTHFDNVIRKPASIDNIEKVILENFLNSNGNNAAAGE